MGFQTPLYELSDYLKWTTNGKIQLPDFQRSYKWEDERIRQLLVTIGTADGLVDSGVYAARATALW